MTENYNPRFIGNRIREARKELNYTQADLGDSLGITQAAVHKIESGVVDLSLEHLFKLPKILGKPVSYFLGVSVDPLTADEAELLEVYRSIPPGSLKENALNILQATARQARKTGLDKA